MNLNTAENIASLYEELINGIDVSKIEAPLVTFSKDIKFNLDKVYLDGESVVIDWYYYFGNGESERTSSYHKLEEFFTY